MRNCKCATRKSSTCRDTLFRQTALFSSPQRHFATHAFEVEPVRKDEAQPFITGTLADSEIHRRHLPPSSDRVEVVTTLLCHCSSRLYSHRIAIFLISG